MPIAIRDATADDVDAIAEVHVASWRWAYAGILPNDVLDELSVPERRAMWGGWFASSEDRASVLVAVEDARIVGFTGFGPSRDDDAASGTGEVRTLYLLEAWVGRGIGRELFREANVAMRMLGYVRASLWVFGDQVRTRRFYEAAGWAWDGTTSAYEIGGVEYPIVRYAADL